MFYGIKILDEIAKFSMKDLTCENLVMLYKVYSLFIKYFLYYIILIKDHF